MCLLAEYTRKNLELVRAWKECVLRSVFRQEKVMVSRDSGLADEQATAPNEFVVSVYPDIEILPGFTARHTHVKTLDDATTLRRGKQQCSKENLGAWPPAWSSSVRAEKDDGGLRHSNVAAAK